MIEYRDVAEVVECKMAEANYYLEQGYLLLGIHSATDGALKDVNGLLTFYVKRGARYVVGRTKAVPHAEPPEQLKMAVAP